MFNYSRRYELIRILLARYSAYYMGHASSHRKIVENCDSIRDGINESQFNAHTTHHFPALTSDRWLHIPDGLRVHESPKINREGTTGYYTDHFCDSTAIPIVVQLPARHGKVLTLAGYKPPDEDTGYAFIEAKANTHASQDIEDCVRETAFTAHSMAESYAEDARDENAKQEAEHEIDLKLADIAEARKEHAKIVKELRHIATGHDVPRISTAETTTPALCDAIRSHMKLLRKDVHKAVKRIKELRENYWLAVDMY